MSGGDAALGQGQQQNPAGLGYLDGGGDVAAGVKMLDPGHIGLGAV